MPNLNYSDVPQDVPQERKRIILQMISENPKITQQEIAENLDVNVKTIKRDIAQMPNVKYVGSGYSGHWEIIG